MAVTGDTDKRWSRALPNSGRVTLVLFRRRALGEQSGAEPKVGARVRKSRQKEAAGAADAGLMQIEWSKGEVLKRAGVGTEEEEGADERVGARIDGRRRGPIPGRWRFLVRSAKELCPVLRSKAAVGWSVGGWPGSRSDGYERSPWGADVGGSGARIHPATRSSVSAGCGEPSRATER